MHNLTIRSEYLSAELAELVTAAAEMHGADIQPSTRATYARLNATYDAFCELHGLQPHASETVAVYIAARVKANDSKNTLTTRLAAIARRAAELGLANPLDHPDVKTIARNGAKKLARKPRRVAPATYESLPRLVGAASGPTRVRDVALVLLGFAIGRRGSELAGVDVEHISHVDDGIIVEIPRSKTNQTGEPEYVGVPRFAGDDYCPIAALETWLAAARITTGPVFRTLSPVKGRGGNRMRREDVSRRLEALASAASLPGFWASHSLRRGVVTSSEQRGVARSRTRLLTGWSNDAMFSVYADHRDLIEQSPLHEIYGRRAAAPKLFRP